ncbi:peroxide stress protein YaaA [Spongiibacter sp. KMU-158]|uniref:UPF0246 protein IB286_01395 n=1 Tax=Spongiibacter pelagi TaxID=2760804 RepID=A0A927GV97_9GAMM|nr:peroxide stress protein YaaA [Spongiibacter pelagi]MBD2857642.1 peroxide stress protein YaaA [Spongiibacter pelagi]
MLIVISPAKTLDFDTAAHVSSHSDADFLDQSALLIDELRQLAPQDISSLMKISDKLGTLNYQRFADWSAPFSTDNAKQAVLAFKGDVYTGLDAESLDENALAFAQQHLRILSGLYGLLRPLDLMQAYRLEMGTKFANQRGKNLYEFWGKQITDALNIQLEQTGPVLVNLASNEYFSAVKPKQINGTVITPIFKDRKGDNYKIISFYAKKARGLMTRYAIDHRVEDVEQLKAFDSEGYYFCPAESTETEWVFLRETPVS